MRVLHILGERGFSGGEDQLLHVVRALEAAGHENRFVLQEDAAFVEHAEAHGSIVGRVRMRGWQRLFAQALRRVLAGERADLVHLADSRAHKLGLRARADRRAPVVVTRRMDYPVKFAALKRSLHGPRVAAFVAISQAVADELVKAGVEPSRVHVIHDGVDETFADGLDELRAAARAEAGFDAEHVVVLSLASLRPRKGQVHLVDAFQRLRADAPQARLVLAGDGSDRDALEARIGAAGLDGVVHLPGRVAARPAMAAADIACVPSLKEGLSIFSLEAQLAERPVVASAVGGLVESVDDGTSGTLVPPGDPAALARALDPLLRDAALRARMGAAGRARVLARFTAARMAAKTVALYETLAGGRASD